MPGSRKCDQTHHQAGVVPAFACSWTNDDREVPWVRVSGELDIATTPRLVAALHEARPRVPVAVLDLRAVTFADSSALHAIVDECVRAKAQDCRVVLVAGDAVRRIFAVTENIDAVDFVGIDDVTPAVNAVLGRAA